MSDADEIKMVLGRNSHRMFAAGIPPIEFDWVKELAPETWPQWSDYWLGRSAVYADLAGAAMDTGQAPTAGEHFLTASLCAHFAQFMIFNDSKVPAMERAAQLFGWAAGLLRPPVEIRYATDERTGIAGIPVSLALPDGPGPHPCVVIVPGLEANKIEMQGWQRYFTARGMAFAAMEGPGQGELHDFTLTMPHYSSAVSTVVDLLQADDRIDSGRIGLCGVSLGGLLASMALAQEPRFVAAAEVGGTFDSESRWERASWISKRGTRFITRSADDAATEELIKTWTLYPVAHQIECPFLVVHGDADNMIPVEQVELYRSQIKQAEVVVIPRGNHVCNNQPHLVRPMIADWFRTKLQNPEA